MHHRQADRLRLTLLPARFVAVLCVAALTVVGCGDEPTETDDAVVGSTTTTIAPGGINALDEPGRVPSLIREHLGENPEIRRLSLSVNGFTVQVRDPEKRDNMDDYNLYNGDWTTRPVSVSLSEIEEYESVTFSLGDIDWDKVPDLIDQALAGLDLEGEEIGGVSFDKLEDSPPRIYISVNGVRGTGRLLANADGTNVDISRN